MKLVRTAPVLVLVAVHGFAQSVTSTLSDLPRLKTFSAQRTSSNNRYVGSNDDSKRIMPGETLVMADLIGPGVVDHIWLTVADNEYAWPRLVRLRVYYDGKKTPSVDVPLGDTLGLPKIGRPSPNKTGPTEFKLNIVLTFRRSQPSPRKSRALHWRPAEFVRRVDCFRHISRSAFASAR